MLLVMSLLSRVCITVHVSPTNQNKNTDSIIHAYFKQRLNIIHKCFTQGCNTIAGCCCEYYVAKFQHAGIIQLYKCKLHDSYNFQLNIRQLTQQIPIRNHGQYNPQSMYHTTTYNQLCLSLHAHNIWLHCCITEFEVVMHALISMCKSCICVYVSVIKTPFNDKLVPYMDRGLNLACIGTF